jgi:hypothetical protein
VAVLLAVVTLSAACVYVQETPESKSVRVVTANDVGSCKHQGKVTVSVVKMARGDQFVREDLIRLARNKAAASGADTIVPAGEPRDSEQVFDMYRCHTP